MVAASRLAEIFTDLNAPVPPPAEDLVQTLDAKDRLVLAAWDAASTLGLAAGSIDISDSNVAVVSPPGGLGTVRLRLAGVPGEGALIEYPAFESFLILDPNSGRESEVHDVALLLKIGWYVRYRIDALLYLPPDMRQQRLTSDASWLGVEKERLLSLMNWFPALEAA